MAEFDDRRARLAVDMLDASNRLERTQHHELRTLLRQAAAMLVRIEEDAPASRPAPGNRRARPEAASARERVLPLESLRQNLEPVPTPMSYEPTVDVALDEEPPVNPRRPFATTPSPAAAWRAGVTVDAVDSRERVFAEDDEVAERKPARRLNWPLFALSFAIGLGGPAVTVFVLRYSTTLAAVDDWQSIILFAFVAVQLGFGAIAARALWPVWKERGWGLVTDFLRRDSEA